MIQCKNCGYPVIAGMRTCPNCQVEMPDNAEMSIDSLEDSIPVCTLRPIPVPGERPMPAERYEEGAEVMLSRQNTVPHDRSIADTEQACLFFADGYWFIEDRSADNSTYVHAGAGIKLEPGDIIRMGGREFEFDIITGKDNTNRQDDYAKQ